jgi:hypothetical protein
MPTPDCVDFFGAAITPGCYIVYGTLLGRCAAIKTGKVLKVEFKEKYGQAYWSIRVRSVERGWRRGYERCQRDGTIAYPERAIVVSDEMVPHDVLKLLES